VLRFHLGGEDGGVFGVILADARAAGERDIESALAAQQPGEDRNAGYARHAQPCDAAMAIDEARDGAVADQPALRRLQSFFGALAHDGPQECTTLRASQSATAAWSSRR